MEITPEEAEEAPLAAADEYAEDDAARLEALQRRGRRGFVSSRARGG